MVNQWKLLYKASLNMNSHLCFEHFHKDILTSEYKASIITLFSFKLKCSFAKYTQVLRSMNIGSYNSSS